MLRKGWRVLVVLPILVVALGCGGTERQVGEADLDLQGLFANSPTTIPVPEVDGFVFVPTRSRQSSLPVARILGDPGDRPPGFQSAPGVTIRLAESGRTAQANDDGYFVIENPSQPAERDRATFSLEVVQNGVVTHTATRNSTRGFIIREGEGFFAQQVTTDLSNVLERDTRLGGARIVMVLRNDSEEETAYGRLALSRRGDHPDWQSVENDQQASVVVIGRSDTETAPGQTRVVNLELAPEQISAFNSRIWQPLKQNPSEELWAYIDGTSVSTFFSRVLVALAIRADVL